MTLYTFDRDIAGSGKSACNGALRHALAAGDRRRPTPSRRATSASSFATTALRQWAYKGKPVYTYAADKKAGDATGDNFKDSWHVIK